MAEISLSWSVFEGRECLCIRGLSRSSRAGGGVAVFPADALERVADSTTLPPVAGDFIVDGDTTQFVPRFPFVDGLAYALVVASNDRAAPTVTTLQRPARVPRPSAVVTEIYPTASVVPFNLLRMYVYFSASMIEGAAATAVQAVDTSSGQPLHDVFYRGTTELWDSSHRRLTLLLDPGRIKRGLLPHETAGYPLTEGMSFTVCINEAFRDASGAALEAGAGREYQVGPALRSHVRPGSWDLSAPAVGSLEPLVIEFGRPLDHALLEHCLSLSTAAGDAVTGSLVSRGGESAGEFHPAAPWRPTDHLLTVDGRLEDVAGNSTTRVFDRDLARPEDDPMPAPDPVRFTPTAVPQTR